MDSNRRIQNIFKSCFPSYDQSSLPLKDIQAAQAIMRCRTPALGYRTYRCPNGHEDKQVFHSCRYRSCPLCAQKARHDWVERQKQRLLTCAHYHVIFTLPHEYLPLWQYNRAWFTQVMFRACRDTLIALLGDERFLGALPGILMTLHTWGRQLNFHPHIHCLVTAGGITAAGIWKHSAGNFLLPVRVVKTLFRGKMQAAIKAALQDGTLVCPGKTCMGELLQTHRALFQKQWSVRIEEKYAHGRGVRQSVASEANRPLRQQTSGLSLPGPQRRQGQDAVLADGGIYPAPALACAGPRATRGASLWPVCLPVPGPTQCLPGRAGGRAGRGHFRGSKR
jgi:hypothetical protein